MKKILSILSLLFILTSCFNNSEEETSNLDTENNQDSSIETQINLDEEILEQEKLLKDLEEVDENEIDELINTIIE